MKITVFFICLLLPNLTISKFLKNFLSFSSTCPEPEENYAINEILEECEAINLEKMKNIPNNFQIIHEIFDLRYENLNLMIAYNINNAIELGEFLTGDNKLMPRKKREEFPTEDQLLYDFILDNVHLYKDPNSSSVFFAYPIEVHAKSYTNQLIFEIMRDIFSAKLILTLTEPPNFNLNFQQQKELEIFRLFEVVARILRNVMRYRVSSIMIVKGEEKPVTNLMEIERNYLEIIDRYTKNLNATPNGKLLARFIINRDNIIFLKGFTELNHAKVFSRLDKIPDTTLNNYDYLNQNHILTDCWYTSANIGLIHSMNSLPSALDSELAKTKSSTTSLSKMLRLESKIERIHDVLSTFLDCMNTTNTTALSQCFQNLNQDLADFDNPSVTNFTSKGYNYSAMMCFIHVWLDVISNVEYISESKIWTRELEKYLRMLRVMNEWYHRLRTTYYQIDTSPKEEIVESLNGLLKELENDAENVVNYSNRNMMRDAYEAVKLNSIKANFTVSCMKITDGQKLQVRGNIVKLSLIMDRINCQEEIRIVEIFASDKVFIDTDILAVGKELMVSIFSPVWEVVLERIINLDGFSRNLTTQDYLESKAQNGSSLNANGGNGRAGLLGGPAGVFYGLAQTIINAEDLKISLNGGDGTNGQDGGDGTDGEDGLIPNEMFILSNLRKHSCKWYSYTPLPFRVKASNISVNYDSIIGLPLGLKYTKNCYIFGLRGFPGGNGGNGGIKGKGGFSGDFKLFSLDGSLHFPVNVSISNGTDGRHGFGGRAGKGGVRRKLTMENFNENEFGIVDNETITRESEGNYGIDGISILGSEIRKEKPKLQSFGETANLYKRFIFSQIRDHRSKYIGLYKQMVMNIQIVKSYDTITLVNELRVLEEEYHLMRNKSHALVLYQFWKEGILENFLHRRDTEKTKEYHTILRFLDKVVSEKIKRIQNSKVREIFIFSEYLAEIQKQLKFLKNARKVVRIKITKAKLTEESELEIERTQQIIQADIQREIDSNDWKFTGEIEMTLRKMASSIEKKENLPDIRYLREKFAGKVLNDICAILNIGLGLLNPTLAIIRSKFSQASSQIQNFIDDSADRNIIETPKREEEYCKFFKDEIVLRKKMQAGVIDEGIKILEEKIEGLLNNREEIKPLDSLAAFVIQLKNTTSVHKLPEGGVVKLLDDQLTNQMCKKLSTSQCVFIPQLRTQIRIKQMVGDLFSRLELNDTNILNILQLSIDTIFQDISKIRNFQEEVFTKIVPLGKKISMESFSSATYLDLKNFDIRKSFEDILSKLQNLIAEFNVLPSFITMMRSFRGALERIYDTFDVIHEHVEEVKKIPYVKDLHLSPFDLTYVKDAKLGLALTKMIQLSFANSVLDDYDKWMGSFKQYIFPFVKEFTHVFRTIESNNNDLVTIAEESGNRLETYGLQLKENRLQLSKNGNITLAKFEYDNPFHIWRSNQFSREINRILSGERVTLLANISEHQKWNAVKFSDLWLRFSSSDPEVKEEDITRDLESFSVKLLHNGDSYYRCDERLFVIPSKSYDLEKMYSDGKREMDYDSVNEISEGTYILSPYATWTIELVSRDDRKSNEALRKYESKINIELVGFGQFSLRNIDECDSLEEYRNFEIVNSGF